MAIFAVTTTIPTNNGQHVWFPFECEAEDVRQFWEMMKRDKAVIGTRYRSERGTHRLIEPEDRIVTLDGVATIGPYRRMGAETAVSAT